MYPSDLYNHIWRNEATFPITAKLQLPFHQKRFSFSRVVLPAYCLRVMYDKGY